MGQSGRVSPRRITLSPALQDNIRHRYEHTNESLEAIAEDVGCVKQTIKNLANREGWVRYVAPPRDFSPDLDLRRRAESMAANVVAMPSSPPERSPEKTAVPEDADDARQAAKTLLAELNGLLAGVRAAREKSKREGASDDALRSLSRTVANLTGALRALNPLLSPNPITYESDYDDVPADLDEFREALARRIEAFMESRGDEEDAFTVDDEGSPAAQ